MRNSEWYNPSLEEWRQLAKREAATKLAVVRSIRDWAEVMPGSEAEPRSYNAPATNLPNTAPMPSDENPLDTEGKFFWDQFE